MSGAAAPSVRASFIESALQDPARPRVSPFRIGDERLSPEQWVNLLSKGGVWMNKGCGWLGACCADISAARDILARILREDETVTVVDAWDLCATAGRHDSICEVFQQTPGTTSYHAREGSPWPLIARICRQVLGEDGFNAACGIVGHSAGQNTITSAAPTAMERP